MEEFHYVYRITYTDVPNVYYGSRTCRCLPEDDVYWGTPVAFKEFMDAHASTRIKTILYTGFGTREKATSCEADLIRKQWDIDKPLSLNAHIPGEKFCMLDRKHKPETRKKMSDSHKGEKNYFYGGTHKPETIKKISESRKGKPAWNKGIPNSPEARKKMSKAHKGRIPEHRVKSYVGIPPSEEPVFFRNATKFCRDNPELNFTQKSISACAIGTLKSFRGWQFLFEDEYNELGGVVPPLPKKKYYVGISPNGDIHIFDNAKEFAKDNSELRLQPTNITKCARGEGESHKGWQFLSYDYYESLNGVIPPIIDHKSKTYVGISPTGERIVFTNAEKFCEDNPEYGLRSSAISTCVKGRQKTHKGWKFLYADESDIT